MSAPARPASLRARIFSHTEHWLRLALGITSAGFILLFLYTALRRLHYPFSMEQVESGMLISVWRILHGQPLYTRPTPDFVPYLYSPIYYYLAAAVSKVLGFGYPALRIVSVIATLGSMGVLYALVYGETRRHLPSLAAAGFYAACYTPLQGWFDIGRVDSLFVFFFLLAIYCTRRAPILIAALAWVIAFQTKQGVLPIALLIFCSDWYRPRRMLLGMGALIAGIGGSILWLNHATSGWYNFYVFGSTRGLGWLWRLFVFYIPVDFFLPFGLACLLILAAVVLAPPSLRSKGTHFFLLVSFAVYASIWFIRAHAGSATNTLMPAYAWTAALFGLALARLLARFESREAFDASPLKLLVLSAAVMQLLAQSYNPGRFIPSAAVRQAHQDLINQLHAIPGDIFVFNHNDDELFAGKPLHALVNAFGLITQGPPSPQRDALIADFRQAVESRRYSAIVTDDRFTPEYLRTVPWPTDMLQLYPVRIPAQGADVPDVTSSQPREKWIYLPCSALDHDISSIIPAGAAVDYGACPNEPAPSAAKQ